MSNLFVGSCRNSSAWTWRREAGSVHYWIYALEILAYDQWRRKWHPTPVLLPGESHGRRSLVGCSPWGRKESDKTEWLHFHFSLSCIGEGNGKPLLPGESQGRGSLVGCRLKGVAQSWTRLKRLSSSSLWPRTQGVSFWPKLFSYTFGFGGSWSSFYCPHWEKP